MKKRKIGIIITLVLALIMAAVGFAAMFSSNRRDPEEKDAHHYISRGEVYYRDGDYQMALASYQKAVEADGENAAALLGRARTNEALGYLEDALKDYQRAAAALPQDPEVQLSYIRAMITAGRLEQAKLTLEPLLAVFDNEAMDALYSQMTVLPPSADLQPGTYDSYQRLQMSPGSQDAIIYYTLDGSEPNRDSTIYGNGVVISAPDTVLKARCINHLGYESETVSYHYTITVPVKKVLGGYSSLAHAVRDKLQKGYREPIYNYEAAQITSLFVDGQAYYSSDGATTFYASGYSSFGAYRDTGRGSADFTNLRYMPFLETLGISWQNRVPLDVIAELSYLKNLSLLNNNIKDISELSRMTGLEKLALGWNRIQDIRPLAGMKNLTSLGLWNNEIRDITPISGLTELRYLDIANNEVTSLEPISQLTGLQEFWANGNRITSIMPLDPAGSLKILMIANNPLTDYSQWKAEHAQLAYSDVAQ